MSTTGANRAIKNTILNDIARPASSHRKAEPPTFGLYGRCPIATGELHHLTGINFSKDAAVPARSLAASQVNYVTHSGGLPKSSIHPRAHRGAHRARAVEIEVLRLGKRRRFTVTPQERPARSQ
jgi:hypothetical protein